MRNNSQVILAVLAIAIYSFSTLQLARADVKPKKGDWFTQNGAVILNFEKKSTVTLNGAPAPTLEASPADDLTMGNALGYYFSPNISMMLVLGVAAETNVFNQTTALGKMNYGAPSLILDYHFTDFGAVQPFVGVGVSYIHIFISEDAFIKNLEIDDTFGFILRAGAEVMISEKFGFFFAANKIFASTEAHGFINNNNPIHADIDLNPWVFQIGFTNRF